MVEEINSCRILKGKPLRKW